MAAFGPADACRLRWTDRTVNESGGSAVRGSRRGLEEMIEVILNILLVAPALIVFAMLAASLARPDLAAAVVGAAAGPVNTGRPR
jgi:hypothetical protein